MERERATSEAPRRRSDGEETHAAILDAAMRLASIEGLGSLTIGRLARELDISKSGVFAHFRSKERLQQETITAADRVFRSEVLEPTLAKEEGLAQVEGFCEAYLSYIERGVFPGGCFFAQLLAEYDAQAGPIHDRVVAGQQGMLRAIEGMIGTARGRGELAADTDAAQLAFELCAALEFANYLSTLNRDHSGVEQGRIAVRSALAAASPRGRSR